MNYPAIRQCPVCGKYRFEVEFEECPICSWMNDVTQEENISNALTGIYPYYKADESTILELPEKVVQIQSTYAYPRIAPVDFSSSFESGTTVTVDMLREAANSYIKITILQSLLFQFRCSLNLFGKRKGMKI